MSRAADKALAEVTRAAEELVRWATAVREAEEAAADAEAAVVTDPSELDAVGDTAVRATARAAAARRGYAQAAVRLADARRRALLAEADDEEDAARRAQRAYDDHARKVATLREQLEALDGVAYWPPAERLEGNAVALVLRVSRSSALYAVVMLHETRAAVLRYTTEHGRVPALGLDLRGAVSFHVAADALTGDQVPDAARAYAAALAG